jgi:hypothetical protein
MPRPFSVTRELQLPLVEFSRSRSAVGLRRANESPANRRQCSRYEFQRWNLMLPFEVDVQCAPVVSNVLFRPLLVSQEAHMQLTL